MATIPATGVTTLEKVGTWCDQQIANHTAAKAKMTDALAKDFVVTDWLFEDLLSAQAYVRLAHNVKAFVEEADGTDRLMRYVRQSIFVYRAPNGSPMRSMTEGFEHKATLEVASLLGMDGF